MSPVSPVFHAEVTVKEINCLTLLPLSVFLFGKQDWVKTRLQTEVLTLIRNITENRLRQARGPVHSTESVTHVTSFSSFTEENRDYQPFYLGNKIG